MKDIDKKIIDILLNKPDLIVDFPDWMLSDAEVKTIRTTENIAIAEIAGRDSIAAVIRACDLRPIKAIVPTIAYTGTEYGNWKVPFEKIDILKDRLQKKGIKIYDPIVLGSPKFWGTLCGRYVTHFFKAFQFFSHCLGCHLYFHAIRIPLAKALSCNLIIGGERESHDGKLKVNQIGVSLNAYINLLKKFDIELFLPIRHVKSGEEVESILDQKWEEGDHQLECVLSKNYQEMDGSVILNEEAVKRFFDEFALAKAEEVIKSYLVQGRIEKVDTKV